MHAYSHDTVDLKYRPTPSFPASSPLLRIAAIVPRPNQFLWGSFWLYSLFNSSHFCQVSEARSSRSDDPSFQVVVISGDRHRDLYHILTMNEETNNMLDSNQQ
ncbi:hypothetical protein Pst134EB_016365 [Puccinia striiformis f. sp. tritici]|nr:hypothetical protein Pst134EB_016365 [Puccinia striiformis f. sp. tritici]